jgi:hypothetical protein
MKKLFISAALLLLIVSLSLTACKKGFICDQIDRITTTVTNYEMKPEYSTVSEFKQGISQVAQQIQYYRITAYLDTLPNGYPNKEGRKVSLSQFAYTILEKLNGNQDQIASAVYDVFHFDESTFSLISYLMKAKMVGEISAQTLAYIVSLIPLPPVSVAFWQPPLVIANPNNGGDCCTNNVCNPQVKILVTWAYKTPCGNREKKTSGYAANDKLTHMSGGKLYRFDAEVSGCPCPGKWTATVTPPAGASYGEGGSGKSITLVPVSSGVYTITFTYKVCDKTVTKTFTLQID